MFIWFQERKFAENKTTEVNDKAAEFISADFELDSDFFNELLNSGADEKARKIANKLIDNDAFVKKIVDILLQYQLIYQLELK